VRTEHVGDHAGDLAITDEATAAIGHLGEVAVHHGDLVTLAGQLEQQVESDVAVPAHHEGTHGQASGT
jgi:hypothetical protein